ncbi:MAG: DUF2177 family protein [Actinomycetota bacterium]|nr:MAG: transmembrane [Actinomycetota bacterium]MDO8949440.1 DUF2177 family protein [Actinomycetota bacterium]MDP3631039.1 DUF2177 family protein [Actinomycetota bacterium]
MTIGKLGLLYGACIVAFFAIDFVWLSTMTSRFYQPLLGDLMATKPKLAVAAGFYLLYVIGVVALAVVPGLREGAVLGALWRGALFGLLAYATYDLTNLSTIQDWPWQLAVVDMVWGTVLTGSVSVIGYYAGKLIGI